MSAPRRIHLLPEHLIDQIKAGEVIERPANVLKELLENSLDAGSTKIDVEIRENGLTLLRVTDNGSGIMPRDLELAFGRHATSKIERFEDLYRLSTFGFRGEALPSIASVSRLECVSWTKESPEGASIRFEGGVSTGVFSATKTGLPHGTVMTVQDLFFNTPVRLKFMQSAGAEKNWLKRFFYAFLLANPKVEFSLQWEDNEKLLYSATADHTERIRQLFSPKVMASVKIHHAHRQWQGLSCSLFLISAGALRTEGPLEHVLINARPVLDKSFPRIVQQVLEKHWHGDLPAVLLMLDVPGEQVDVNVHPNKTVVKFHQHNEIISLVTATLRECLPQLAQPLPREQQIQALPESSPTDLTRDREESYTRHLEELGPLFDASGSAAPATAWYGPYFIQEELGRVFYVNGKALLCAWAQMKAGSAAESVPLLVSHPLRDVSLTPAQVAKMQQTGLELDELDAGFWVIRAIPSWLKGLPLDTALGALCRACGVPAISIADFSYEALSPGKWGEIWQDVSLASLLEQRLVIELSPELFTRGKP